MNWIIAALFAIATMALSTAIAALVWIEEIDDRLNALWDDNIDDELDWLLNDEDPPTWPPEEPV
jgi:hypothetical protein